MRERWKRSIPLRTLHRTASATLTKTNLGGQRERINDMSIKMLSSLKSARCRVEVHVNNEPPLLITRMGSCCSDRITSTVIKIQKEVTAKN